jgi:NADH dehydrogenase (ubiquinone) flavoprotein 2
MYADAQIPFEFNEENLKRAHEIISRYPPQYKKGAVMPILDLGQRQNNGWTSISVMNAVAKLLEMPKMRVYEVSSASARAVGRFDSHADRPGRDVLHDVQP